MPLKHIPSEHYSRNVSSLKPNVTHHPDVIHPPTDTESYLLPAVFTVEKGSPITGTYVGPVVVYVVEGELQYEDTLKPGEITVVSAGDVVHITGGTVAVWNSPSKGKGFAVLLVPSSVKGVEEFAS
ncbi:hypothetical protein GALMADRAFT_903603 [Galerina marginata CBS 339.88]|uniref:(S)-ureidoglycine aminohydrolase cupin domain-containing protein n=1 Tax=Galerina marginata (strain CBS 339.88) TaxID=685588 RepID=A0A067STH5_GALM3|nr:hypothetical protein GALMADRAFT_903603 [Galerina marginata CBS 339.88]